MASKWSDIWAQEGLTRAQKEVAVQAARFTLPSGPKSSKKAVEHSGVFFKNRKAAAA